MTAALALLLAPALAPSFMSVLVGRVLCGWVVGAAIGRAAARWRFGPR